MNDAGNNTNYDQKKVIWFKKSKCAGTSFESVLKDAGVIYYVNELTTIDELEDPGNKVICVREALFPYGGTLIKHGAGDYELINKSPLMFKIRRFIGMPFEPKIYMLEKYPEFLEKYPKFAVVRNPYDKFISSWKYLKSIKNMPIEDVINNLPSRRHFHDWIHITQSQANSISDKIGNLLVDQIIYMESEFNKDINNIFNYIGMRATDLPMKNKSTRNRHHDYLTTKIINKLEEIYLDDFSVLGYSTDINILEPIKKHKGIHICG